MIVACCGVSRRYIDVCYCDMFSVVNVYLNHLKFCVVCINSRRYVCCSECNVVSNVFVYGRYHTSRLVCLKLWDLDWSRHHPLS